MKITLTPTTHKMGAIPSVSLAPIATCPPTAPCRSTAACYACRLTACRPTVRAAWMANAQVAQADPARFFAAVRGCIAAEQPPMFRWHVAGDIPSQRYLDAMKAIAKDFPATRFLAFTKAHALDFTNRPHNLAILASVWPGWGDIADLRRRRLPIAWLQDGTETRVPLTATRCAGHCEDCARCWHPATRDIVFAKR